MTVYVDDMKAKYRRMLMCHMIADTEAELHAMAARIGVRRKWYQGDHYDICMAMRAMAVKAGAVQVTQRQLGAMVIRQRATGSLGSPVEAIDWCKSVIISCPRKHGRTAIQHMVYGHREQPEDTP